MQRRLRLLPMSVRPILTVCVVLVAWGIVTSSGWINPLFLPRLTSLGRAILSTLSSRDTYVDIYATSYRALGGLALSFIFAVPLGLLFGRLPGLYAFVELPVDFFRSIPSSSLFLLFVLFFGLGDAAKIAVVFYGCSLILLVNTVYGARPSREKQDRINMLRSFGANPWQVFSLAVLRDAIPHISAGVRVCVSLALVLVIVTEMFLSAANGLGRRIYDHYLAYRVPEMYAVIIVLGLLGFCANRFSLLVEQRITFWLPRQS